MNLTKLFNFKYLYENIKKSKMAIILFSILLPVFTTLMLITGSSNNEYINFLSLGSINIAFMYVVPFIFSFCLFGYIYKKTSVDFMGSMPLSRKTIYFTNVIGGIGLVIATQLITLILTFLASTLIDTIIFPGLIWDVFLYQSIAYIYMFAIATLAMSFSGNVRIQLVIILLLLCLLPASHLFIEAYAYNNARTGIDTVSYFEKFDYTAPLQIFTGNYNYNGNSIIKMLILSAIYFGIGFILFDKRKMEVAGESFLTNKMHLIIKSLTLSPFVMLLMLAIDESELEIALIVLTIAIVYWFLYDLITNKKIKFMKNISTFALAIGALVAVYLPCILVDEQIIESLDYDDVVKIEVDKVWIDAAKALKLDDEIVIKDKKAIRSIMNIEELGYDYYDYNSFYNDEYTRRNYPRFANAILTFNNGRKAVRTLRGDHLSEYIPNLNEYMAEFIPDMKLYGDTSMKLTSEAENYILTELSKMTPTEMEIVDNDFYYYSNRAEAINDITTILYKNHQIYKFDYDLRENLELLDYVVKLTNQISVEGLKNEEFDIQGIYVKHLLIDEKAQNEYEYKSQHFYAEAYHSIIKFIAENANEIVDVNKDMYSIKIMDDENGYVFFTTNKIKEFEEATKFYLDDYRWEYENRYYDTTWPSAAISSTTVEIIEKEESAINEEGVEIISGENTNIVIE